MKIPEQGKTIRTRTAILLALAMLTGCGGYMPYKTMADAAQGEGRR